MKRVYSLILIFCIVIIGWGSSQAAALNDSTEQCVIDFIRRLPQIDPAVIQKEVDNFLDRSNIDESTYTAMYNLAGKYLNNLDSPMRDEEYYILFLNHAVNKGKLGEADKERARFRLEMAEKNRPGSKAPDFRVVTREGEQLNFLDLLSGGENIVVFYDPDCNHCVEVMEIIENEPSLKSKRIIAIDSETDRELWNATCMKLPQDWVVGFALDYIQDDDLFIFPEMPTIYVINGEGTIILKDASLEKIIL
ncbi:MAG: DUF5106 domain-containing protein [Bacteroides sp.]|nr:DUF5106 domain-containing protein [Bacteroides sp.]